MKTQFSEISGNIAWLFEKIKKVDEQINRFENKDEFLVLQFKHQKKEFVNELNEFLITQQYNLQVKIDELN